MVHPPHPRPFTVLRWAPLLAALAMSSPSQVGAATAEESRQALVLAYGGGAASADALSVSRAALAAGFEVRRIEDSGSLPPAGPADLLLVYRSGQPHQPALTPDAILARYGSARRLAVIAETCSGANATADPPALPEVPASALAALSATPDRGCGDTRVTEALVAALAGPPGDLATALTATGLPVAIGADWARSSTPVPTRATSDPLITAAPVPVGDPTTTVEGSGVEVFRAAAPARRLPAQDRAIRPVPPGYPEPSVIVGEGPPDPLGPDAPFAIELAQVVTGETLGIDHAERDRIRAKDPALFRRLMASGGFDPAAEQMAAAIQAELQRVGCYASRVDGIWGKASREAVDRYFALAGGQAPGREPDAAMFRAIAGGPPDLRCPPPVVPPAVSSRASGRGEGQPAGSAPQPAPSPSVRQPEPPPAAAPPAAAGSRRINPNTLGSGIFR